MQPLTTAILHLREPSPLAESFLRLLLAPLPGVRVVDVREHGAVVAVRFDGRLVGVADIVRVIEDLGPVVSTISPRRRRARPRRLTPRNRSVRSGLRAARRAAG